MSRPTTIAKPNTAIEYFSCNPESSHYAKTNPIAGVALEGQNRKINAAHPEQRLKAVRGQKASAREKNGSNEHRYGTEHQGKASTTKLTRDQRRQNDQRRRRQGRQKPYAAKRVSKDNPTNSHKERQEWRLVYITPGQMIAAGQVKSNSSRK